MILGFNQGYFICNQCPAVEPPKGGTPNVRSSAFRRRRFINPDEIALAARMQPDTVAAKSAGRSAGSPPAGCGAKGEAAWGWTSGPCACGSVRSDNAGGTEDDFQLTIYYRGSISLVIQSKSHGQIQNLSAWRSPTQDHESPLGTAGGHG